MAASHDSAESGVGNCTKESFLVGKLGAPCFFVVLVLVTRSHNHRTFPREYAEWDRSIALRRCFHAANLTQSLCNQVCWLRRICVTARGRRQV